MNKRYQATLIGFIAILLWSLIIGLIKEVSHSFGPTRGAAFIYSIASILLVFTVGWTPIKKFRKKYLIAGSILMVSYELCLALSIGYSQNTKQAIEVGMVNYLWPTFTMLSAIIFNNKKTNWLIVPGVILSMTGIIWVLGGKSGFNFSEMLDNIKVNPLSYGMAFFGAFLWAAYTTVTTRAANGVNGITLFFILVAVVLWIKYLWFGDSVEVHWSYSSVLYLLATAAAMGFGYAAWNQGILHGNVTVLAGASYFIPVLSSVLSSLILTTVLGFSFWRGAFMVCFGSILCWVATASKDPH